MRCYLRQHDRFSCGPIALLNLHKWQGLRAAGKDLRRYQRLCHCFTTPGTPQCNFSKAVGKPARRISYQSFKQMLWSGRGGAVILTHPPATQYGHYWFVPGIAQRVDNGKLAGFFGVNFYVKEKPTIISWRQMKYLLRHSHVWMFQK